ncbi:MAG: DnaJ domain-containing protein [Candidatus Brocadiaceae bacterium]|nr:DnaJ domain-containing protein [Candidatus Brocadiaceae bacterium]
MSKYKFYFLIIILIIYIVSPLDLHPLVFDDILASVFLCYIWQKFKGKKNQNNYSNYTKGKSRTNTKREPGGQVRLDEAYKLLHVSPDASWSEVQKAYKERMAKTHPDKVAHLSEELQEKSKELSLEINNAYRLIKQYKES